MPRASQTPNSKSYDSSPIQTRWLSFYYKKHRTTDDNLKLSGFVLSGSIPSKHHCMATFVRTGITWSPVKRSPPDSNIAWLVTEVQETTIVKVYKPPPSELYPTSLPSVPAPAIYAGDFNCQHTDWGYKQTTKDGETLSDWASSAEAVLLYDPKEPPSFFSARWNTYTNPDLAFAVGRSFDPKPERRIIDRFPRSHHRPSIIKVPSLVQPIAGKPVKRWNFRKANWELFTAERERERERERTHLFDKIKSLYNIYKIKK